MEEVPERASPAEDADARWARPTKEQARLDAKAQRTEEREHKRRYKGRKKGALNKATLEKLNRAEKALSVTPHGNSKIAVDYMDDMIEYFRDLVGSLSPFNADGTLKEGRDPQLWFRVVHCFQGFLNMRAPYQSPRLSAVQLVPAGQAQQRTTVNVTILNERGDEVFSDAAEDPKLIEHEASMEEDVSSNEDEAV